MPLREQGELLGLLMVIDADGSLRPDEIELIAHAAARMSALLYADHLAADATRLRLAALVADLLGARAEARDRARRTLVDERLLGDGPTVVAVIAAGSAGRGDYRGPPAPEAVEASAAAATLAPGSRVVAAVEGLTHVVQVHRGRPPSAILHHQAEQLAVAVRRWIPHRSAVAVGVGGLQPDLGAAWRSAEQARVAIRATRRVPRLGDVAVWSELGEYAVLAQLEPGALDGVPILDPVERLADGDPSGRLRETLAAYLDHAGSIPRTAGALHLHRTSLYYRLNQITQLTGVDLDDGGTRFRLHLALRLLDLGTPSGCRSASG